MHLANIHSNHNVVILNDGSISDDFMPSDGSDLSGLSSSNDEDEDEDEDVAEEQEVGDKLVALNGTYFHYSPCWKIWHSHGSHSHDL